MRRRVALIVVIAVIMGILPGCGSRSKINDTLDRFEGACSNLDVEKILDCIDPTFADPVRDMYSLYALISKEKAEDSFKNMIRDMFGVDFEPKEFLNNLKMEDRKIKSSGRRAAVRCRLTFEIKGETFKRNTRVNLRKYRDEWYITGFELDNSADDGFF